MVVIGVTGSFGTGKSTVARMFGRRGARVIDADRLAHQCMARGSPVWRRLRRRFGGGIVPSGGAVDRRALAKAGFASRRAWADLCRIVHPAVIAKTRGALKAIRRRAPQAVVVLDVPLLIESGMTAMVDWVVVVTAPRRVQLARLSRSRRWPAGEVARRLKWQMPLSRKVCVADVVIDNGGSRRVTAAQVHAVWNTIRCQAPSVPGI